MIGGYGLIDWRIHPKLVDHVPLRLLQVQFSAYTINESWNAVLYLGFIFGSGPPCANAHCTY